jgi:transforming growth factor-beta-induced protein
MSHMRRAPRASIEQQAHQQISSALAGNETSRLSVNPDVVFGPTTRHQLMITERTTTMKSTRLARGAFLLASLSLVAAACGSDDNDSTSATTTPAAAESTAAPTESSMATSMASSEICDADGLVAAVQGGTAQGTLEGMADDPVATAASNNPVLTTLVTAVGAAGLGDTLNSAEALTVFAPTDCAFAQLDPATLKAALDDPTGLLTTVLGFHVIPERLSAADLADMTELTTFTGETLELSDDGGTITLNGGSASVLVPDIQTSNATVFLIDNVMLPPSVTEAATDDTMTDETMTDATMSSEPMTSGSATAGAADVPSSEICSADDIVAAVQGGAEQGTLEGMADDPVATAASNNPVLTTLVAAVGAAGLGDTLNGAEALTVFAPTDCAFAKLDAATMDAAMADPTGLLTTVLGYHVVTERLSAADLASETELTSFTGEALPISVSGDVVTVGGQAMVIVGDIQTSNATVFLVDTVMIPPSVG